MPTWNPREAPGLGLLVVARIPRGTAATPLSNGGKSGGGNGGGSEGGGGDGGQLARLVPPHLQLRGPE